MNVKAIHVNMKELVWMVPIPILATVLLLMLVQTVVVIQRNWDLCVKCLKAQVSSQIYLYHPLQN